MFTARFVASPRLQANLKHLLLDRGLILGLAAISLLIVAVQIFIYLPISTVDVSVFLVVGNGWNHGQMPYLDLWDHKPPLIYVLGAMAEHTSDPWLAIRLFSVGVIGATAQLCGWLIHHFGGSALSVATTVLVASVALSAPGVAFGGGMTEIFAAFFMTLAASLLILRSFWGFVLAGAACAMAIGFSLEAVVIIPVLAGLLFYQNRGKRRFSFGLTMIGGATAVAIISLPFLISGALWSAVDALVRYNDLYRASAIMPTPGKWLTMALKYGDAWILPFGLVLCILAFMMLLNHPKPKLRLTPLTILAFAWLGLTAIWIIYGARFYAHYVIFAVVPTVLLFGAALTRLDWSSRRYPVLILRFILIGGCVLGLQAQNISIAPDQTPDINGPVVAYIDAHSAPGDLIYVWGDSAQIYLAASRQPAGKYFYLLPMMTPRYAEGAVAEELSSWEAHPPVIVVDAAPRAGQTQLAPLLVPHPIGDADRRTLSAPLEPLRDFIRAHYVYVGLLAGQPIYQWASS